MFTAKDASRVALRQFKRSNIGRRSVAPKSTAAFGRVSSPESEQQVEPVDKSTAYSNTISFASPESDFSTSHILMKSQYADLDDGHKEEIHEEKHREAEWSKALSFSSPESDFTSIQGETQQQTEWSNTLSFTSPESDFASGPSLESMHMNLHQEPKDKKGEATKEAKDLFFQNLDKSTQNQDDLSYSLSLSSPESDFSNPEFTEMLNERMKKQLDHASAFAELPNHDDANQLSSMVNRHRREVRVPGMQEKTAQDDSNNFEYQELRAHAEILSHEEPLPRTMEKALIEDDDRAIVVTEASIPFNIVKVNSAWERLCGYTNEECIGKTLRCIQGDETNQAAVTALMSQLLRGEEAATVLVNYRKDGSKFSNRLRVGTLKDDQNSVTHFVGILKEVEEMADTVNEGSRMYA